MLGAPDIIKEAQSLPVEDRVAVVDSLLQSLNSLDASVEEKWTPIAQRRLEELRKGKVNGVPGKEVFARVRERLGE